MHLGWGRLEQPAAGAADLDVGVDLRLGRNGRVDAGFRHLGLADVDAD